jgi:hypothetical protein
MSEIEKNREFRRSYSTFTDNKDLFANTTKRNVDQIRRDDDVVKTPKCTIIDIDFAIMSYIRETIQPQIIENNALIDVPVFYANGEKWAQYQKRGYVLDDRGKIMTPYIGLRRNSMTDRPTLKTLAVNRNPSGNEYIHRNKFTKRNKYDRFSVLQGIQPSQEYYLSPVPEFVDVSYDLLIWTEYTDQMNSIIEQVMPLNGFAWGTTWKFPTFISDYSFESINTIGEDRIVRASLPLTVKGTMLMPYELRVSNLRKMYSIKKITFGNETTSFNANVDDPPPGGY